MHCIYVRRGFPQKFNSPAQYQIAFAAVPNARYEVDSPVPGTLRALGFFGWATPNNYRCPPLSGEIRPFLRLFPPFSSVYQEENPSIQVLFPLKVSLITRSANMPAQKTTLQEFESVYPKLEAAILDHAKSYKLPESETNWFKLVSHCQSLKCIAIA